MSIYSNVFYEIVYLHIFLIYVPKNGLKMSFRGIFNDYVYMNILKIYVYVSKFKIIKTNNKKINLNENKKI